MKKMKVLSLFLVALATLSLCVCSSAYADLVCHYEFDDANDVGKDTLGLRSGQPVGGVTVTYVPGEVKVGSGALDLPGLGAHLDLPSDVNSVAALNGLSTYTIAGWAKIDSDNNFVEGLFTTDIATSFGVHLYWYNTLVGAPHLDMQCFDGWVQGTSGVPAAPTGWFHFAAVRNGVNLAMYLTGSLIGTATTGGTSFSNLGGGASIGSWQGNERYVTGQIDDLRIYNHALTVEEICALPGLDVLPRHSLTMVVESPGTIPNNTIPPIGVTEYVSGTETTISAPRFIACPEVLEFDHWVGDVGDVNSATTTVLMDVDKTVTAYYRDDRTCGDECHPIVAVDANADCRIDLTDFADFAGQWLDCTQPECDQL